MILKYCKVACLMLLFVCLLIFYHSEILSRGLLFVDAGRFAIVARNLINSHGFRTSFEFYTQVLPTPNGWVSLLPPVHILLIAFFMKLFGVNDFAVMMESFVSFFLSLPIVYLLARKIFNPTVGLFSVLFVGLNPQLLAYAKDGASEPIFIFLIVSTIYLIQFQKRWTNLLVGYLLAVLIFTKLQSYILVPLLITWSFLLERKMVTLLLVVLPSLILVILNRFGWIFGYYRIWIPSYLLLQQSSLFPGDNITRSSIGAQSNKLIISNIKTIASKFLYNLYNFYKIFFGFDSLLPSFTSPFISLNYFFSNIFLFTGYSQVFLFRIFTFLMLVSLIILSSLTSPSIRYIQVVIPLASILAVDFLFKITKLVFGEKILKQELLLTVFFAFFFVTPFLGRYFIDYRFINKAYNTDKPYAGKVLGEQLQTITALNTTIVTNLQTWGSWYGDRVTMLIPVDRVNFEKVDKAERFDYIYLTDYQKDNQDHPLNGDWQKLFDLSIDSGDYFFTNFTLDKEATISASQDYENQQFTYKLWRRKAKNDKNIQSAN